MHAKESVIIKNTVRAKERGMRNIIFRVFDGIEYPFANETFDLIVTRFAFHHFPNVLNAVEQMNKLLVNGGKVLISDPMRSEKDHNGIINDFMKVKKDGHICFYSQEELDQLFIAKGFLKEKQIFTNMKFPFEKKDEYVDLYNNTADEEKCMYDMVNESGIVWIRHIDVSNTLFIKA